MAGAVASAVSRLGNTPVVNIQGICKRCADIPWEGLATGHEVIDEELAIVVEKFVDLVKSSCRLCRLLGWAGIMHTNLDPSIQSFPPYRLLYNSLDIPKTFGIGFKSSTDACGPSPHLIVTCLEASQAHSRFQRLYPEFIDIERIKLHINDCNRFHRSSCASPNTQHLIDLRVIDCDQRIVVPAPLDCQYVALSYVWGRRDAQLSLSYEIKPGIILPQTIEDSIFIAQSLGYKYLWIDRYCIDQSHGDHKAVQIKQMGDIYAASQLTIVAAVGDDPYHGLSGAPSSPRHSVTMSGVLVGSAYLFIHPSRATTHRVFRSAVWATRAWTLQEFYFAPRRLVFTPNQVIYVCNKESEYEIYTYNDPKRSKPEYEADYNDHWGRMTFQQFNKTLKLQSDVVASTLTILEEYSKRNLTFEADALNAISGALKRVTRDGMHHIWGVPFYSSRGRYDLDMTATHSPNVVQELERKVEVALLWYHSIKCQRRKAFPSWSPIGWTGPMLWFSDASQQPYGHYVMAEGTGIRIQSEGQSCELFECADEHNPETEDMLLKADTYLKISGRISKLESLVDTAHTVSVKLSHEHAGHVVLHPQWDIKVDPDSKLIGLLLLSACISDTLLRAIGAAVLVLEDHESHYERVGIAKLSTTLGHRENRNGESYDSSGNSDTLPTFEDRLLPDFYSGNFEYDILKQNEEKYPVVTLNGFRTCGNGVPHDLSMSEYWWWKYFTLGTVVLG